jgi:hypothetical protein
MDLTQSTAFNRPIFMVGAADHISGLAGLTLTITVSKDGGAFASITPTVTDLGSGWYNLALTTTHTNTLGALAFHITGTAADPLDFADLVVAGGSTAPTAAQVATAVWTDLLASSDFSTAASIGKLLKDDIDAAISSRLAASAVPTNFGLMSIDADGRVKALVGLTQNKAFSKFQFRMVDSSGDPVTGLVNGDFNKKLYSLNNGATFGTIAGSITEDAGGEGFYYVDLTAAELNARSISLVFDANAGGTIVTAMTIWPSQ